MFRIWAKEIKDNHLLRDITIANEKNDTRTHKIFAAITEICKDFDLSEPIWLESNINDFKKNSKVRFYQDSFIDKIEFDYLEVHVIEEDD
ncbi:MAG: hypothetical protein LBM02_07495 [Lachnospiraceae bacterium]|jgi:hypothetical protein|nr:hypothetical protein [Lachnospiraceae bacterium]